MSKNIIIQGSTDKTYDLDELSSNSRVNSERDLVVQVWEWNANINSKNPHSQPNPPDLEIGQIWLSKWLNPEIVADKEKIESYNSQV